ncbi:hypothetical protein K1719_008150 [Acacia pycnantha]|nr:hypothetical protein K1719_008150 [Acacia pycnantha]
MHCVNLSNSSCILFLGFNINGGQVGAKLLKRHWPCANTIYIMVVGGETRSLADSLTRGCTTVSNSCKWSSENLLNLFSDQKTVCLLIKTFLLMYDIKRFWWNTIHHLSYFCSRVTLPQTQVSILFQVIIVLNGVMVTFLGLRSNNDFASISSQKPGEDVSESKV